MEFTTPPESPDRMGPRNYPAHAQSRCPDPPLAHERSLAGRRRPRTTATQSELPQAEPWLTVATQQLSRVVVPDAQGTPGHANSNRLQLVVQQTKLRFVLELTSLARDLDWLASETWDRVIYSFQQGFLFGEDSITENNLFSLSNRHPEILTQRFNAVAEAKNGADWEWRVGADDQGWVCLRFQAKKVSERRYYGQIGHKESDGRLQYEVLIDACADNAREWQVPIWPFYCFYNGWASVDGYDASWPYGVEVLGCPDGIPPPGCRHAALRDYGCAVAPACDVAFVHQGQWGFRTKLEGYLARCRPWSQLFRLATRSRPPSFDSRDSSNWQSIALGLSQFSASWARDLFSEEGYAPSTHASWLTDARVEPGDHLPGYAQALLDGEISRRGNQPEAKFVTIINFGRQI